MKKEYIFVFAIILIALAYGIDSISGKLILNVKNHFQYLSSPLITQYPLTTLGIFGRSVGIFFLVWLSLSLIDKLYFQKAVTLFVVFVLGNLYSIQQLTTGMRITTPQWTISIGFAAIALLIPMTIYFISGLFSSVSQKITRKKEPEIINIEPEKIDE